MFFAQEHINADDVIVVCLDIKDKMQGNLINIESCAIVRRFDQFDRFSIDNVIVYS